MTDARLVSFAERVRTVRAAFKADMKALREEIAETDLDAAAVMRLASWMDKDETDRLDREAVDEQYRFLAGVLPEPAELPESGQIATAAALYADGMTVRAVAKEMGVSTGRAHKLKVLAAAFTGVHRAVNVNVNKPVNTHRADPETGELPREMTAKDLGDPMLVIDKPLDTISTESVGQPSAPAPTADVPPEPPSSPTDPTPAITDADALAAMDDAHAKLMALRAARKAAA